jgi:hypothetical protein
MKGCTGINCFFFHKTTGNLKVHHYSVLNYHKLHLRLISWDSSVCIVKGYGPHGPCSISGGGNEVFSSPQRPDWFWGPPSLLYNVHRVLFPQTVSGHGVKQTTYLYLVKVKNGGVIPPLPHASLWRAAKLITHRNKFISSVKSNIQFPA